MGLNKRNNIRGAWGYLLSAAGLILTLVLSGYGILFFSKTADREGDTALRKAIAKASVQCYAIEGRYPPDVAYLEDHYGVMINHDRYSVFYEGFASNIMPDITVIRKEQ